MNFLITSRSFSKQINQIKSAAECIQLYMFLFIYLFFMKMPNNVNILFSSKDQSNF